MSETANVSLTLETFASCKYSSRHAILRNCTQAVCPPEDARSGMIRPATASTLRYSSICARKSGSISGSNCAPSAALDLAAGDLARQCLAVGAVGSHSVVGVGDGHEALRVAGAVPGLVVAVAAGHNVAHEGDRLVGCSGGNGSAACSTSTTAMPPDRGWIAFWDTTGSVPAGARRLRGGAPDLTSSSL
jgi:hypothetical protein